MTSDKKAQAYGWYVEAEAKYSYFMAGVAFALTGYLAPKVGPLSNLLSPDGCDLAAVVLFMLSSICAVKRLEGLPHLLRLQVGMRHAEHQIEVLRSRDAGVPTYRGKIVDPAFANEVAERQEDALDKITGTTDKVINRMSGWAKARDYLLFAGLFALVAGQIWTGLGGANIPPIE